MIEINKYENKYKNEWNYFIDISKNGTFLFNRNYMDYHSDRFIDYSLMIYQKGKLVAVFPANIQDDIVYSHQGLTYGGLIYINKLSMIDILNIFDVLKNYCREGKFKRIIYKAVPYIYSTYPAQEDLYALFRNDAKLVSCNLSSTISLVNKVNFIESRKSGIRKAIKNNLTCTVSNDFDCFWDILSNNLKAKYDINPVHSLQEIEYLHSLFPENINLFIVKKQKDLVAGTVLYISKRVVHVQYISASPEGQKLGALDLLFDYLINNKYFYFDYLDFGYSTEKMGYYLNEKLLFQKEGFGGRGIAYNIYELNI